MIVITESLRKRAKTAYWEHIALGHSEDVAWQYALDAALNPVQEKCEHEWVSNGWSNGGYGLHPPTHHFRCLHCPATKTVPTERRGR